MFPNLEFKDSWREEGGFAGNFIVYNGNVTEEDVEEHDWLLEHDSAYSNEYEFITKGDYKKVLKNFIKKDELCWSSLNPFLLDRLKDEDLPLFIEFEWHNTRSWFENRLKGVTHD